MVTARITGSGHAVPAGMDQQRLWDEFFDHHFDGQPHARRVWSSSGVVDPAREWSTRGSRMSAAGRPERGWRALAPKRYRWGRRRSPPRLAESGIARVRRRAVRRLSCTGYGTPGLDVLLARDLGMSAERSAALRRPHGLLRGASRPRCDRRLHRCPLPTVGAPLPRAAQPARAASDDDHDGRRASEDDVQQMVAHALFSDAAAAVVLQPGGPGLELTDVVALTDTSTSDHMTWDITDLGFKMGLSPRVPDVLALHVRDVVDGLLARHDLRRQDVAGWAVHPGGPRILDVVEDRLDLAPEQARGVPCRPAGLRQLLERDGAPRPRTRACRQRRNRRPRRGDGVRPRSHPLRRVAPRRRSLMRAR